LGYIVSSKKELELFATVAISTNICN